MAKSKYYKHPKFGHVYGEPIATPTGRASWPMLVTPREPPPLTEAQIKKGDTPGKPRYEVTLLIPKKDEKIDIWLKAVKSMTNAMLVLFNEKRPAKLGECALISDGDEFDLEKYPYYADNWVLVARNEKQPVIKSTKKIEGKLEVLEPKEVVGGMKCRAVVTPLVTAHGVSYKLEWVQVVHDDGVRFGGGVKDFNELLEDLSDEELGADEIETESQAEADDDELPEQDEDSSEDTPEEEPVVPKGPGVKRGAKAAPQATAKGKKSGLKAGLKLI